MGPNEEFSKKSPSQYGNQKTVGPAALGSGNRGEPVELVGIYTPDGESQRFNISIMSETLLTVTAFPLTGIVKWGNGGGTNQIEFDIPQPFDPALIAGAPKQSPLGITSGGVTLQVSASSVFVFARCDAALMAANGGLPATIGDPAKIQATIARGGGGLSLLRKSIRLVIDGTPLAPLAQVTIPVPAFAKRVWIKKQSADTVLAFVTDPNFFGSSMALGANNEGPIELDGSAFAIIVRNTGAGNITSMSAVFDLEVN